MTKYRIVNDGYADFLQYQATKRFLFFTWVVWEDVWKPCCNKIHGRVYSSRYDRVVNSYDHLYPEKFATTYPDIEVYFNIAREQQKELERESKEYWDSIEKKKGQIRQLN